MTYWLDGTTTVGPLANLSGTQLGYRFTRSGKTILTVWDYKANTTMSVPVSAPSAKVCDWMGNCKTETSNAGTLTLKAGIAPLYLTIQSPSPGTARFRHLQSARPLHY